MENVSSIVGYVYDTTVQYQRGKFHYYRDGDNKTLSAPPQPPKKVWEKKPAPYEEKLKQPEKEEEKIALNLDRRVRVVNTTTLPYSIYAQLTIVFQNTSYGGSGVIVGPHHLLTCAHNVYDPKKKIWAEKISIYPALDKKHAPFDSTSVVMAYTFKDWTENGDQKFNMALLVLDWSIGKYTGWGGVLSTKDTALLNEEVHVTGYPRDKDFDEMWNISHKIKMIYPEQFAYETDTCEGKSEGAIWIQKYALPIILGIHNLNFGIRISEQKFTLLFEKVISDTYKLLKGTPDLVKRVPIFPDPINTIGEIYNHSIDKAIRLLDLKAVPFTQVKTTAIENTPCLPGRLCFDGIRWVQFGSTDVFFYMTQEKYALTKNIVKEINQEKLKLTVDINDYDCLTTEISAIASKYPRPINYEEEMPIFADPIGHTVLESYSKSLQELIANRLGLNLQGVSREINFIFSQDAHKFHQDQSGIQFEFLKDRDPSLPPCKIIQDLTLVDWDMSVDTFSATIVQDSISDDRFLLALFPKEIVGMLFMQSPIYLTREAHPSYSVPTIFPYHAVLSPIDRKSEISSGSSKGKRLSTVLRGVAIESEITEIKQRTPCLPINRPIPFKDDKGGGHIYKNGVISREMSNEIRLILNKWNLEEGNVYKNPDRENVEILEISDSRVSLLSQLLAAQFGIALEAVRNTTFLQLIKKDSGFSVFNQMGLEISPNDEFIILNSSRLPDGYDYFNLAEDCTSEMLPWIQLYHFSPEKAFLVPSHIFSKLSLTPIEEILFRKADKDSMKTDGAVSLEKIVTKISLIIFKKSNL